MSVWENCFYSIRKSSKPIHAGNEDILNTTVLDVCKYTHAAPPRTARSFFTVRSRGLRVQNFAPSVSKAQNLCSAFSFTSISDSFNNIAHSLSSIFLMKFYIDYFLFIFNFELAQYNLSRIEKCNVLEQIMAYVDF